MKKLVSSLIILLFVMTAWSQNVMPTLGEKAPSFKAKSTNGNINFPSDFGKSWKIIMSHPRDFTPVCTSEILQLAIMQQEFKDINVELAIISTDVLSQHESWKKSIEEININGKEVGKIDFPFIEDEKAEISRKFGMLHASTSTTKDVRGVFILDPENVVQAITYYPMTVGRNMEEIKRLVIALQQSVEQNVLIPANWIQGGDVLVPYKPYTDDDVVKNPDIIKDYYSVGISMWYKKQNN